MYQSARCFEPVVAKTFVIRHIKVTNYCGSEFSLPHHQHWHPAMRSLSHLRRINENHYWPSLVPSAFCGTANPIILPILLQDAAMMIDEAILTALTERKPVYLEIPVNVNGLRIPIPSPLSFAAHKKVERIHCFFYDVYKYTGCMKYLTCCVLY